MEIPKSDLRQFDQILEELEKEGIVYYCKINYLLLLTIKLFNMNIK